MDEERWLACENPLEMIHFLRGRCSHRKGRLFPLAWIHSVWQLIPEGPARRAAERAEVVAEGLPDPEPAPPGARPRSFLGFISEVEAAVPQDQRLPAPELRCCWLRCIHGNPFCPVAVDPSWMKWRGGLIVCHAQRIYDTRDFSDMSILADMLEDAGCRDGQILAHCRGQGPHCRGCFVVDALLGKN
jgi:hypothetical protein